MTLSPLSTHAHTSGTHMASVYIIAPTGDLIRLKGGVAHISIRDGVLIIDGQKSGSLRIVQGSMEQLMEWRAAIIRMLRKQAVTRETIFIDLPPQ